MAKKADNAPAEAEALEGEAPKKSKKKLLIIIILAVVLLGVLGGGGFFGYKWWSQRKSAPAAADNASEHKAEGGNATEAGGGHGEGGKKDATGDAATPDSGVIVSIPPLLVNLADPQGRRYLKIALDVEMSGKPAADELNKNLPKVKDALLLLLSSKSYDDLSTLEDKILLKKEIVERLTLVLGEQKVQRVYITEIVIQ